MGRPVVRENVKKPGPERRARCQQRAPILYDNLMFDNCYRFFAIARGPHA